MKRFAVIGTGISGMAAAYLLSRAGHTLTVYESEPRLGGHSRTLSIPAATEDIAVDTGFIVFNKVNYPHLTALFELLDVPIQKSSMSLAVTVDHGKFEWGARSLNAVFGQRRNLFNPRFYGLIRSVMRFNNQAEAVVNANPNYTLDDLLKALNLDNDFMRYYLLPMGGAIWSCPPKTMLDFPAVTFVQFFKNHGLMSFTGQHQWYTVCGGSRVYVDKLTTPYREQIRTSCAVTRVISSAQGQVVTDVTGHSETYDEVIFACHADQALAMISNASEQERRVLGAFQFQRNIAYLHRDPAQMPKRKACWASWVYQAQGKIGEEPNISVTYWMNSLQGLNTAEPVLVTLNPIQPIPEALTYNVHTFEHPIFTRTAIEAQQKLPSIQGKHHRWFCGAYTRYGFHEDGLLSAVRIAESLGVPIPWR